MLPVLGDPDHRYFVFPGSTGTRQQCQAKTYRSKDSLADSVSFFDFHNFILLFHCLVDFFEAASAADAIAIVFLLRTSSSFLS